MVELRNKKVKIDEDEFLRMMDKSKFNKKSKSKNIHHKDISNCILRSIKKLNKPLPGGLETLTESESEAESPILPASKST